MQISKEASKLSKDSFIFDKSIFHLLKNWVPDGYSAEGFFLPQKIGGIFLYEEDKPIRGIGAIEFFYNNISSGTPAPPPAAAVVASSTHCIP